VDFGSGTIMLQSAMVTSNSMMGNTINISAVVWGLLLYGLATLLIITGVLGTTRVVEGRMLVFGSLMTIYGIIMLVIGSTMFVGITPMMQDIFASTLTMFAVGLGMILNGMIMMISSSPTTMNRAM
jgi:hypothetical protein